MYQINIINFAFLFFLAIIKNKFYWGLKLDYEELVRNIGKAGLTIKEFAKLIKANPNSITNLSNKKRKVPKNLAIISVLLGELVDNKIDYKPLFDKLELEPQKARVKNSFGKSNKSIKEKNATYKKATK